MGLLAPSVLAGSIETAFLEQPWPKERVRVTEVGRHQVRWRERAGRHEGIFAGVRFTAPLEQQAVWELANDYRDLGTVTPGVTAVRYLERSERRQVIQVDVKVLWKKLQLTFEVEQEPPKAMRFRLVNQALGEYRGLCVFDAAPASGGGVPQASGTVVELSTWLKTSRPVPQGLLLAVERMTMLRGVREFLESCEQRPSGS